jgi:phospholipase C
MPFRWARICWVMTVVAATIGLVVPADAARAHTAGKRAHVPVVLRLGGPRTKLKHIVFFVKENRSFDHYFGAFPDPTNLLDQATTASCAGLGGVRTFTMDRASDPVPLDVSHSPKAWAIAYRNGAMDGFCNEHNAIDDATGADLADSQMHAGDIPSYWAYANTYGIGDRMFASWRGASFANNIFAVAAQSGRYSTLLDRRAIYGIPQPEGFWGCDNRHDAVVSLIDLAGNHDTNTFPCFGFKSIPNLMDAAGVTWKFYGTKSHFIHSGIAAMRSIRCAPGDTPPCTDPNPYWDQHVVDTSKFVVDANAGRLPAVSWYLPDETEHPPLTACAGENASVRAVNAVMNGADWASTAIVVWWDEWGGFYDHVKPPAGIGIDDGVTPLNDLISYGFRVPLLVISPWVKRGPLAGGGYASHVFYSDASLVRLVEYAFNLGTLGAADDLSKYTSGEPLPGALLDFFDFSSATPPRGKLIRGLRTCPTLSPAQQRYVAKSDDD